MKKLLSIATLSLATMLALSACENPGTSTAQGSAAPSTAKALDYQTDPNIVAMVPADIKSRGTITVAVNPDVPPIKFTGDDGKITGAAPQLIEAAAKIMGLKAEMQLSKFDALIPGLESDRIDVVASIGDFKERQEKVDFIDYLNASTSILAAKSFKTDNATLMDLCGTRVAYAKGTQQQGLLETASKDCTAAGKEAITASSYATAAECILSVKSGQADATWQDSPAVLYNVNKQPNDFKSIYTAPNPIKYGIAFSKNDKQFQEAFRAALLKVVEQGGYSSLLEGYGIKDLALPELPVNSGGPQKG